MFHRLSPKSHAENTHRLRFWTSFVAQSCTRGDRSVSFDRRWPITGNIFLYGRNDTPLDPNRCYFRPGIAIIYDRAISTATSVTQPRSTVALMFAAICIIQRRILRYVKRTICRLASESFIANASLSNSRRRHDRWYIPLFLSFFFFFFVFFPFRSSIRPVNGVP